MAIHTRSYRLEKALIKQEASDHRKFEAFKQLSEVLEGEIYLLKQKLAEVEKRLRTKAEIGSWNQWGH